MKVLLNTYITTNRSKLDYGSIIYGSGKESTLKKLDPIHNTALRIITGAFRTSPILSILKEANEPPLKHRRKLLCIIQAIKISTTPNKSSFKNTFSDRYITKYNNKKLTPKPFYYRVHKLEEELNITFFPTIPRRKTGIPPWVMHPIEVNIDLTVYKKSDTNPVIFRNLTIETIDRYRNYIHIYTDGSKTETGTGYAVITPESSLSTKLAPYTSIFTAEATAINHAIKISYINSYTHTIIFTDSMSTLEALSSIPSDNGILLQIQETNHEITEKGHKIILAWIPGHVGIPGNEKADQIAKQVANSPTSYQNIPTQEDLIKDIRNKLKCQWESEWRNTAPPHIKNIDDAFFTENTATILTRKEQTAITRIRIGHSKISHSYILSKEPIPICEHCNTTITTDHLILDCQKYNILRRKHKLEPQLKENLTNRKLHNLLGFIKEAKLIDKI
ncbi:uncharacterized protein LOC122397459 [Colletes gigas]|uniref:uncharacterized protein LOC122397459 n=1 Tax=Colletes gigas TaxID=935657 RepID=UPI001C9A400A|nr:uncharacterized protein LOC122397459 [Colletes gigas]